MPKFIWPVLVVVAIGTLVTAAVLFFKVDATTYTQVERSEPLTIDTAKPVQAPNGIRLQDLSTEPNDKTYGNVFPYLAAPQQ